MLDIHNVEIVKTRFGETVLLDGKEIKGLKDFTVTRKANDLAILQLELFVGDVKAVNRLAEYDARAFEKWADNFNRKFNLLHKD